MTAAIAITTIGTPIPTISPVLDGFWDSSSLVFVSSVFVSSVFESSLIVDVVVSEVSSFSDELIHESIHTKLKV